MTMSFPPPFSPISLRLPALLRCKQSLSLHQFKVFFVTFVNAVAVKEGSAVWTFLQPFLADVARILESILG